ncbi:MAG: carbon-nitrogen hydrolase family protein [bacterium]
MKIGQIQTKIEFNKMENINKVEKYVKKIKNKHSNLDIITLPEMFNCPYDSSFFKKYSEFEGEKTWQELSRIAKEYNVYLFAGSIPEIDKDDNVFNTAYIFNREGKQIGKYRKVHLFDIDIEGGQTFRESDTITPGDKMTIVDTEFGKIGIMICYDIRFPEWARLISLEDVKAIIVPGAFNMTTGPAHWELLFRTRAVDNQLFMIATAPAQDKKGPYVSYANSMLVSPWGKILDRLGFEENYMVNEIDLKEVDKLKKQLPVVKHRRKDIYKLTKIMNSKGS